MKGYGARFVRSIVAGMTLSLMVAVPALAQSSQPATDAKVVFTVGQTTDITSLNPFNLCCAWDYSYLILAYDLAFGYGPDLSPAPNIVTDWEHSEDYMTWTLTVRDDAVWHDGTPLTAEDIAFSFTLIAENSMPFYKDYLPFEPTFEAVDDTTVVWTSTEPTFAPEIPAYVPILPEHIWGPLVVPGDPKETRAAVKEFENAEAIGSGPFKLAEWSEGQFLRFEANPDYWGGTPASIDEIVVRIFGNQEGMSQALRSGAIDYASDFNPSLFNAVTQDPNVEGHVADGGWWNDLAFNFGGQGKTATNHPAIQDLTVRQAVALAVDKQTIVDKVFQGVAEVGDSVLVPGKNGFWYDPISEENRYPYNVEQANQLLDDAGYLDTDGDGTREMPDGTNPLRWEVMSISDVAGSVPTGQLLKGYMADIGIDIKLFTVNTSKASDVWLSGDWDVYLWGWGGDPDPDFILSVFTTGQCLGWSDGCFSDPTYDSMYAEQQTLFDRDERKALIDQMQERLAEQLPLIVLSYQANLEAYRTDRFTGYVPSPNVDTGWFLWGYNNESFMELVPVSEGAASSTADSKGLPVWVWGAFAVGLVVIIGAVAMSRRRADEQPD